LEDLLGEKRGYYYTVKQVEIIFSNLGIPYAINENY
jgi:transposase